jgi:gliding motility associated protien GldN
MNSINKFFALSIALFISFAAFAQEPLDGAYQKILKEEKEIITYDYVREADVFWAKRIWRVIDVREKQNLPFKYPQERLIDIIHNSAMNGELTVYDPNVENSDQFKQVLPVDEVQSIGARKDTQNVVNVVTEEEEVKIVDIKFNPDDVIKYRVKEDWIFNENTSTMICRIIGICPMMEGKTSDGTLLGTEFPMYWVYYPDLRPILVKHEVYNPRNNAVRLTWEDLFEARMFQSFIMKESNVHDRRIQEYKTGIDQLFESDKIKQEMFEFEHDLWTY